MSNTFCFYEIGNFQNIRKNMSDHFYVIRENHTGECKFFRPTEINNIEIIIRFHFSFSPESVRWYLTHNKVRTGKKVLRRIARRNGKPEPDMDAIDKILSKNLLSTKESMLKYNYVSLIRNRSTRYKAFILHFMW